MKSVRTLLAASIQVNAGDEVILNDPRTNKIIVVTMWETKADMLASSDGEYFQEQVSRLIAHLERPPIFETFELEVL